MEKKSTPKVIVNLVKSLRKTNENLHIWKWFFSNGLKGDIKIITGYGTVIFIWGIFWLKANDRYFCRFRKMVDYHQYVFHFSRAGQCSNFNKTSDITLHKKWSFHLRISSVNVTKSVGNCQFGHIYWKNPKWKNSFFVQCNIIVFAEVLK